MFCYHRCTSIHIDITQLRGRSTLEKMACVRGKFVSRKASKIRWRPMPKASNSDCDVFVVGSWDNKVNSVSVWSSQAIVADEETMSSAPVENEPKQLCEVMVAGDVTDILYLNSETLAVATSNGNVTLYQHQHHDQDLKMKLTWSVSHRFRDDPILPAPCTALGAYNENLVSVGEDGRLIHYSMRQKQPLRTIEEADSCTMTAVAYLKQHEVITANMQGQFKIWDLRSDSNEPVRMMLLDGEAQSVTCVTRHPTQPSILACGAEDGTLCIWDLRQEKYPLTTLSAHDGPMMEVKFHPTSPNHLFTCSMDGMLWHWDSTPLANAQTSLHLKAKTVGEPIGLSSPWLLCSASKHHLDICSLIPSHNKPINSLDILDNALVCGSDNEAIYVISNLKLI